MGSAFAFVPAASLARRSRNRALPPLSLPLPLAAVGAGGGGGSDGDGACADDEREMSMDAYWDEHGEKWERMLGILDVTAAWESGSLNGILPSGNPSRAAPDERLLSLARAVELFFERGDGPGGILVRRRFRRMRREELAPRWEKVEAERRRLQREGTWLEAVAESERQREFQASLAEGSVESEEASPAASRAVAWLLGPALRAAAGQRDRADGGTSRARIELMRSAGANPGERWITAALLAGIERELRDAVDRAAPTAQSSRPSFQAQEAERDVADAGTGAILGVLAAIASAAIVASFQP